jgi:hypothetical protein
LAPMERRKTEAGAAVTAYRRRTRRGCGRDVEVASFYSRAMRGGNVSLRKEGEREVTAQCGGRASVLTRRRGAAAKGGHVKGTRAAFVRTCICSYVLDKGASSCPRGATRGASAPWLHGYTRVVGSAT